MWNHKGRFYFEVVTGEYLAKKKSLYFAFVDLEKAFIECVGVLYGELSEN